MRRLQRLSLWCLACLLLIVPVAGLVLSRSAATPARPQTPSMPLPYAVEQVAFDNAAGRIRLSGTLSLPRGPGPHPAIVLVPGSGDVDRDGSLFGHQFYLVLADHLTRQGFAVLRSDKRGLGQSGGDFAGATTYDFASDTGAALAFLRSRPGIDTQRIGLVGHSEGALAGSIVAARDPALSFLVLMAGNGIPMGEVLKARGVTEAQGDPGPWMRTLLSIDPQALLRQVRCPVLALVGEKDRVVAADTNIPALKSALAANPHAEVRRLPGLNHFFQTAGSGELSEVEGIEETMSPHALALISEWARRQSAKPPGPRRSDAAADAHQRLLPAIMAPVLGRGER